MRRFRILATGLFTFAGCGDDGVHHLADAPPQGSADAPAPDSPPAPTVTTVTALARFDSAATTNDAPMAGVVVQLLNADLTAGEAKTTGADGIVTFANMPAGTTVTAIYPVVDGDARRIVSMVGVAPGANLVFGDHYFHPFASGSGSTITLAWPTITAEPPVNVYAYTPCGNGSGNATTPLQTTITIPPGCVDNAVLPVRFVAQEQSGDYVDSSFATGTGAAGSTVAAPAWHAIPTTPNFSATFTGFTNSGVDVTERTIYTPNTYGALGFQPSDEGVDLSLDGSGSANFSTALDGIRNVTSVEHFDSVEGPQNGGWDEHLIYRAGSAGSTTQAFTPSGMPFLSAVATVDVAGKSISWIASDGATSQGDALVVDVQWNDTSDNPYHWTVIAPSTGQTSFSWDGYPAVLAAAVPGSDASVQFPEVRVVDIAGVASYADLLKLPEWQVTQPSAAVEDGDLTAIDVADGGEGNFGDKRKHGPGATRATARAKAFAIAHPSRRAK